ncbi:lysoplasmalogenase [Flavobacterium sp. P4023]|uniref:Lysoplasmalogenase n=1 Tax=Flavobacterium flabelliforme TaxID=2816119 RepID=A0ABS5CUW6_9FLAO|nr:lysoplasmalogenase [Flavobacterium flabelliforme]MBP4142400.1 lysoplasmalogenase [Flavobacterium flabelliforme]
MKSNNVLTGFIGFSLIYLVIILLGREDITAFLKPFLLPFLITAVYLQENFSSKKTLLIAITLSWIGDIILLFAAKGEIYFIGGLIAFLFSHVFYIILFNKQLKIYLRKSKTIYWIGITLIIIYLIGMMVLLMPNLGELLLPVFVYAMTISIMLLFALKGFLNWHKPANTYILIGAIIFVASDSILAFDKFYAAIQYSTFLIMSTYLTAQYLIVIGILKLNKKKLQIP